MSPLHSPTLDSFNISESPKGFNFFVVCWALCRFLPLLLLLLFSVFVIAISVALFKFVLHFGSLFLISITPNNLIPGLVAFASRFLNRYKKGSLS